MSKKAKSSNPDRVPGKIMAAWPSVTISTSVAAVLFGYATFYGTDVMGIPALTVGMIFMVSKIFDGFTDIAAGYLIDHFNPRMGKGRPWQFGVIGYWLSIALLFSAPKMGLSASVVWLFVMYSMANSVFMTMINCSDPVYMANSLDNSQQSVSLLAFTGFISLIFTLVGSIIMPQLVKNAGTDPKSWAILSFGLAIPFTLLALVRIFVIKEKKKESESAVEKISVREMLVLLKNNKYILLFALIILISNIGSTSYSTAQNYFYDVILGDIGIGSIMSLSMLCVIVVIVMMPALSKKFGFVKTIRITTLLGAAGYLIRLINYKNIGLLFISNVISMMGFYVMFGFAGTFVINCIDYGEWKEGKRTEGTISCAQSVCSKIGTAVGTGMVGLLMGLSGYEGSAAVQTASASTMIILLYSVIPAILCLVQFFLLVKFDLDDKMPQIRRELEMRKNAIDKAESEE